MKTLACENGQVWQMNTSDLWWAKTLRTDQWSPTQGTPTSPLMGVESLEPYVFTPATSGTITDADDNKWTITANG
ncbi:MAG TPA: hypothetical protein VGM32_07360, partial [Rhodopila sp.]